MSDLEPTPEGLPAGFDAGQRPVMRPAPLALRAAHRLLSATVPALVVLSALSISIDVAQEWPELFPGGHIVGEYVRNLAYALIGALVFNWILIEVPQDRRRRITYQTRWQDLQVLVQFPASLVEMHRIMARAVGLADWEVDAWSRESLHRCLRAINQRQSGYFDASRASLTTMINSFQLALDGLDGIVVYMDPDVAQALALYPARKGLYQLQEPPPGDPGAWERWVHITWELLEAARGLYAALKAEAPYLDLKIEDGAVTAPNGETSHPRITDLDRDLRVISVRTR